MKHLSYIAVAAALLLGATSCELGTDLFPGRHNTSKGSLSVSVTTASPDVVPTRAAVETTNFGVSIFDRVSGDELYTYDQVSAMPSTIQMSVGNYRVEAHSPGDLVRLMSAPYYKGGENVEILSGTTTSTTVCCKMANSRIRLGLNADFIAQFATWVITVSDGEDQVLVYTETSDYSADVFWLFTSNSTRLKVSITATTKDGNTVFAENEYTKANCNETYTDDDTEAFTGGDAITINFEPAVDPNGYITGITVVTSVRFDNEDEDVNIEVKDEGAEDNPVVEPDEPDEPEDPDQPGDETGPIKVTYTPGQQVTYNTTGAAPTCQVDFTFDNGLAKLEVFVTSNVPAFVTACEEQNISGMDLASPAAADLAAIFPLPTVGDTNYTFSMGQLIWSMLSAYGAGVHTFTLKATDSQGNEKNGELTITVR